MTNTCVVEEFDKLIFATVSLSSAMQLKVPLCSSLTGLNDKVTEVEFKLVTEMLAVV